MPARGSSSRNKSIALCVGGAAGTICTAPKPSLPMGLCAQGVPCALCPELGLGSCRVPRLPPLLLL